MTLSFSVPTVLSKAAPIFRYGSIAVLIFLTLLGGISGFIYGLVYAAFCWIISLLCDAVADLYKQVEQLMQKSESSAE